MKICLKALLVAAIVLIAAIPGVYGGEISVAGESSSNSIRNDATDFTIAANLKANNTPAWNNNDEDFDFSRRGFIATTSPLAIPAGIPNITAWNASAFMYFENGSQFGHHQPAPVPAGATEQHQRPLRGQPGIYQVRGFDVSSMTLVKTKTGWIVIDPLATVETARAAMNLVNKSLGSYPVKAVIYSHPHADHYQGVKGVISGRGRGSRVEIIAPEQFMEYTDQRERVCRECHAAAGRLPVRDAPP